MSEIAELTKLIDKSHEQDAHKVDFINPANLHSWLLGLNERVNAVDAAIQVPDGAFDLTGKPVSAPPLFPTDLAYRQLCGKLGVTVYGKGNNKNLPYDYIRALKPELRAYILNAHTRDAEGDWMVRAFDADARAILSGSYAPISNTELLELAGRVVTESTVEAKLTRSSTVTPDSLNAQIIFRDVNKPRDGGGNVKWGIGVHISNGETGNRRGRVLGVIQRASCENSIVLDPGRAGFEFVHRGLTASKQVMIKAAFAEILPFAAEGLERMILAEGDKIPDFTAVLDGLAVHYGWADELKSEVAIGTEGSKTRAGLVNGLAYAAKSIENPDDRADLEIFAGAILVAPDSVFSKAVWEAKMYAMKEK